MHFREVDNPRPNRSNNGRQITHQYLLNKSSDVGLPIIENFLTIGIDVTAANDLFTILVRRDQRPPTMMARQSGPGSWVRSTCADYTDKRHAPSSNTGNNYRAPAIRPHRPARDPHVRMPAKK